MTVDRSPALTPAERERFAAWLESEAATDAQLAEQISTLPGGVSAALAQERLADVAAKRRIAEQIRATEIIGA